ncbi:hypothetical protein, partial [Citrobacter braakii]|uniref:hypothetical protein n=1 Tax=Citrobacter braakii TaxID=57706 RepID=UPI00193D4E50
QYDTGGIPTAPLFGRDLKKCMELKRVCLQLDLDLSIQGISVGLHQPDHDSAGPNTRRKSMNPKLCMTFHRINKVSEFARPVLSTKC